MEEISRLAESTVEIRGIFENATREFIQEGKMMVIDTGDKFRYGTEEIPLEINSKYVINTVDRVQHRRETKLVVVNRLTKVGAI